MSSVIFQTRNLKIRVRIFREDTDWFSKLTLNMKVFVNSSDHTYKTTSELVLGTRVYIRYVDITGYRCYLEFVEGGFQVLYI